MRLTSWLNSVKVNLNKTRGGAKRRKRRACVGEVATEVLEARIYLTSPELAGALATVTQSEASLEAAISTARTNATTLLNTYETNRAAASNAFTTARETATQTYTSTSQTINANLDAAIAGYSTATQARIDAIADAATAAEDAEISLFETSTLNIESSFQASEQAAEAALDATVATATTTLDAAYDDALALFGSTATLAGFAFTGAVESANATFEGVSQGAQSAYETASDAAWTTHEAAAAAAEQSFENVVATAAQTRDAITSQHPDLDFDLEALVTSSEISDEIDNANNTLNSDVDYVNGYYDDQIESLVDDAFSDLNSSGGAVSIFEAASALAESTMDDAGESADTAFDSQIAADQQAYGDAIYGNGGLLESFTGTMATALSTYNTAKANAEQAYSTAVSAAEDIHESTVASIQSSLDTWMATNPQRAAIEGRRISFFDEVDGYLTNFNATAASASATRVTADADAESTLATGLSQLQGPFDLSVSDALDDFNVDEQIALLDYQNAVDAFNQSFMDAMMMGGPMPDDAALNQAVKDFFVAVADSDIDLTSSVGAAAMQFITSAIGLESARDSELVANGTVEAVDVISAGATEMQNAIAGQGVMFGELAALHSAYQVAEQAQVNAAMQAVAAADVALHSVTTVAGEALGLARNGIQETYESAFATAFSNFRTGIAAIAVTVQNSMAGTLETYINDTAAAAVTMINSQTAANEGLLTTVSQTVATLTKSYAASEVSRTGATADKAVRYVATIAEETSDLFVTQNGNTADAVAVGDAWESYLNTVATAWRDYTNFVAGHWEDFVDSDIAAYQTMISLVFPAETARIGAIADAWTTLSASRADSAKTLVQASAAADAAWVNTVAPAEELASQTIASAAKDANDSYIVEMKGHLDALMGIADGLFAAGLPEIQTLAGQIATAAQSAAGSLAASGTAMLSSIVSARQLRDTTTATEQATLNNGLIAEGDPVAIAAAQLEIDQLKLLATEIRDGHQNATADEFAAFTPGVGGGMFGLLAASFVGVGQSDYTGRFLETIADADLRDMLDKARKNKTIEIHHPYQQADAVQDFLRSMKGESFDVHSPDRTMALPKHVHKSISREQDEFWWGRWRGISDADKAQRLKHLPASQRHFSIANVITATGTAGHAELMESMESMIASQDEFFKPYSLRKGATVADLNKLAKNLDSTAGTIKGVFDSLGKAEANKKFIEAYDPRLKQLIADTIGPDGSGKLSSRMKEFVKKNKLNIGAVGTMLGLAALSAYNDAVLAGDPDAPLWRAAMIDTQRAVDFYYKHGYPKLPLSTRAKESLSAVLARTETTGGEMRYIIELVMEARLSVLQ